MSDRPVPAPVVIKLGGDALASPQRIAAQALRVARLAADGPVVAVASARRGVTDHLLGLAREVAAEAGRSRSGKQTDADARWSRAEQDRAVATGEVVSASLLALALNQLGVESISLDAREAGVVSHGHFGDARIRRVTPRRIEQMLARGVVPVVTGFQGWQRGRVATLGRGGTDTSAVALTVALKGERTVFVKEAHGLRTADPKVVPDAMKIPEASHAFLSALTAAGSKVVQAEAAALAELHGVRLEFCSLEGLSPDTIVHREATAVGIRAIASHSGELYGLVTVLAGQAAELLHEAESLRTSLQDSAVAVVEIQPAANGLRFVVPADQTTSAVRAVHAAFVGHSPPQRARRAS
jgi:aspartate kinase